MTVRALSAAGSCCAVLQRGHRSGDRVFDREHGFGRGRSTGLPGTAVTIRVPQSGTAAVIVRRPALAARSAFGAHRHSPATVSTGLHVIGITSRL
jgi:hypothetical protein